MRQITMDASHQKLLHWLSRGCQRTAVVSSLVGIMTGKEIWQAARQKAPRLYLRDSSQILRKLRELGLVEFLTPDEPCGRLFRLTNLGRQLVGCLHPRVAGTPVAHDNVSAFPLLSRLMRGSTRRAVFFAIVEPEFNRPPTCSASAIKKRLRASSPLTLNQTIRALKQLERAGIIETIDSDDRLHRYGPTSLGRELHAWLVRRYSGCSVMPTTAEMSISVAPDLCTCGFQECECGE